MSQNNSIICLDEFDDSNEIEIIKISQDANKSNSSRYKSPEPTFKTNLELDVFIRLLKNMREKTPSKWHQAIELFNIYITEQQARRILKELNKEDLNVPINNNCRINDSNKNYIFHHVLFCRGI